MPDWGTSHHPNVGVGREQPAGTGKTSSTLTFEGFNMVRSHRALGRCAALLVCLAAPAAWAQGTISSGSTFLSFVGTPFGTGSGNANLLFGSTSAFGTDQLFRSGWAYNQGVGTSNRPFSALDTPVQSYVGNLATLNWSNAGAGTAGFARWNAQMTVTLTEIAAGVSGAPGQARVDTSLTFTSNLGNVNSISFSVFNDLDLDIIGTGSSNAAGDTYRVLDASAVSGRAFDASGSNYGEFLGGGATRYEFNTGTALRTKLGFVSGTGTGDLSTLAGAAAADWTSTDGAVAFQWTRTLAPGQSFSVLSSFTINTPVTAVPEPASGLLMLGGAACLLWARRRMQPRA
jgi:hypothetical protein